MYKKRLVFGAACIGMLLFGICMITLGSIAPDLKKKILLNNISSGALFSILPFGILTGSLLFGPLCDKFGYKLLLVLSAFLLFVGFEALANVTSLGLLKVSIFLFGAAGGAINGSTNAVVSDLSAQDKGANLSLLGVCYGIGALGMPFILGLLKNIYSFEVIVTSVGVLALAAGVFFTIIKFPPPKHSEGIPISESLKLLKDSVLILIAFFLFFQSSFEGIIQNWTTSYLISELSIQQNKALFALTIFVSGMAGMRLLIGSVFRSVAPKKILITSLGMILLALLLLKIGNNFNTTAIGLFILGAGLAGNFPIMLGFVGDRFIKLSGTAFSIVFSIALTGNMLINYLMGIIAQNFGIKHLTTVAFTESIIMIILTIIILKKIQNNK